jgi:hypothetical protein
LSLKHTTVESISARFTEEQNIAVLKKAEAGAKTKHLGRRHGISEATF